MRLLANENFPSDAVRTLRKRGHDVLWLRTDAPGCRDDDVLALARKEVRVLVTFDKDFGELAFRANLPSSCGIILFRITPVYQNLLRVWPPKRLDRGMIGSDISLWSKKCESACGGCLGHKQACQA